MKFILLISVTLSGCTHTREPDADERAIIESTRDAQSAGEMLMMLHADRDLGIVPQ